MPDFSDRTKRYVTSGVGDRDAAEELMGTVFTMDPINIIGQGHGVAKTTTNNYGVTITEDFGILDELFTHWMVPLAMDFSIPLHLHLDVAPVTAEVGKLVTMEVSISKAGLGTIISDSVIVFNIEDIAVPETALESFEMHLILPEYFVRPEDAVDDFHIKLKRIAATSDDLVGDLALHHASMKHCRYQR